MTSHPMSAPATVVYEVTVRGHLDDHWSGRLGGFSITRAADGTSTLAGTADQAQLHGVLMGLRDVGVELLRLNTVDPAALPTESLHCRDNCTPTG